MILHFPTSTDIREISPDQLRQLELRLQSIYFTTDWLPLATLSWVYNRMDAPTVHHLQMMDNGDLADYILECFE